MTWDELDVVETGGEARFRVRARPKSRRAGVEGLRGGSAVVAVRAAPERGAANAEIIEVVAEALGVPRRAVRLVHGDASREKTIGVTGLTAEELRLRLARMP